MDSPGQERRADVASLLDALPDAAVGVDGLGRVVAWNAGAHELFGHPRGAMLGAAVERLIHPGAQRVEVVGGVASVVALHRDGLPVVVEARLARVDGGDGVLWVAVVREAADEGATALHGSERRCARALLRLGQSGNEGGLAAARQRARWSVEDALGAVTVDVVCASMPSPVPGASTAAGRVPGAPLVVPLVTLEGCGMRLEVVAEDPARTWAPHEVEHCRSVAEWFARRCDLAALERRGALHAAVLASVADAVVAVDRDGRVTLVNPVAEALTGWTREAAVGRPLGEVLPIGLTAASEGGALALALATGRGPDAPTLRTLARADGREFVVQATVAPFVAAGQVEGAVVTCRDVTEEHRSRVALAAQAAHLAEESARLTTVLATTGAIIYSTQVADFAVEYVSESARAVLGYTATEFMAAGHWEACLHPDDHDRVLAELPTLFATGRHVHEYRLRHRDGHYVWIRDDLRLIRDAAGEPIRAIGASFDISSRKREEERLAALLAVSRIVANASRSLVAPSEDGLDAEIRGALEQVGVWARAERVTVVRLDGDRMTEALEWCAPGAVSLLPRRSGGIGPGREAILGALRAGRAFHLEATGGEASQPWRDEMVAQGLRGLTLVPMTGGGALYGVLMLENADYTPLRPEDSLDLLQLLGDTVASARRRQSDERAVRRLNQALSEQLDRKRRLSALATRLAGVSGGVALLEVLRADLLAAVGASRATLFEVEQGDGGLRVLVDLAEGGPPTAPTEGAAICTVSLPLVGPLGPFGALDLVLPEAGLGSDAPELTRLAHMVAASLARVRAADALRAANEELERRVGRRTRELAESEARFERVFLSAPQAMLFVDSSFRVAQANLVAQQLFGYPAAQFAGLPLGELIPLPTREEHHRLAASFSSEVRARPMAASRVVEALRSDGTTFLAEVGLVPLSLNGERHVLAGVVDVSARVAAQSELVRALEEKETLLQEIHHRVKNNLQIISSLLELQRDQVGAEEAQTALVESVTRVRSMALIHEQLYGVRSLHRIDFGAYARTLGEALRRTFAPSAQVGVDAEIVEVSVEVAVPLGLILNELLTNALKYGLRAGADGADAVLVGVASEGASLRLTVADHGPGLPAGVTLAGGATLGLRLVHSLARQLRATVTIHREEGARFEVVCPLPRRPGQEQVTPVP